MNTDYRQDPLAPTQEYGQNQPEYRPNDTGPVSAATGESGQEAVMGGLSGSMVYKNNINEEPYNDPGQIVEARRNINSSLAGENIVINADSMKETSISGEGKNAIQSLMSSITAPVSAALGKDEEDESSSNPTSINAEVKLTHEDYKRRFQGRPTNRDSKHYTINPEPCTGKFLVTKVRSWRSGYSRIMSLHKTYFTTLDPETFEITNLWYYSQVRHYMALAQEEDCMLIDVMENNKGSTKLKFKCADKNRNEALTCFIQNIYIHESLGSSVRSLGDRHPTFTQCQRLTRHKTRVNSSLVCAPHGLVESDPTTGSELRTYLYRNIRALSFLSDDVNGVVFYINETNNSVKSVRCECKSWLVSSSRIGGSGRSELVTVLKNKFELLAIPLIISESVTAQTVVEMKDSRALKNVVGERMGTYPVGKFSLRRRSQTHQHEGPDDRSLVLTRNGYILECDKGGNAASCRPLNDLMSIVRHSQNCNDFTLEFKGGIQRTYSSNERETVIVSILDATVYMCKNFDATVTDVVSTGYRILSCVEEDGLRESTTSMTQNLFQIDPIETQCIKLVYEVCTATNAYIHYMCFIRGGNLIPQHLLNEFVGVTEVCRQFNANVAIQSLCNLPNENKWIEGTIRALWGLCSTLLKYSNGHKDQGASEKSPTSITGAHQIHCALVPIFQTLYRLMMTEIGYNSTSNKKEMTGILNEIWIIQDSFGLYWSLKCLSALLLPRPFTHQRDNQVETDNKGVLITRKTSMAANLVRCMVGTPGNSEKTGSVQLPATCSDLVSMVASNIIESVLCSHHETTSPVQFASFVEELSKEYVGVMALLGSSASVLAENASLFVRILTTRSPKTAIAMRESALTSGVLLNHFYHALFSSSEGQRHLSRYLCSLWMSGSNCPEKILLKRMIPMGFLSYLSMPMLSEEEEHQLDYLERGEEETDDGLSDSKPASSSAGTNIDRFRARGKIVESTSTESKSLQKDNFRIFFHVLSQDHSLPDLVWNKDTRIDLKDALEIELKSIDSEINLRGGIKNIAWNHEQFSVQYPSLEKEVRVGSVYMRLWLEASDSFIKTWDHPIRLFELLFRRLLCDFDQNAVVTNMCIRCLERLYSVHARKIGVFPDIAILLRYMKTTTNMETKHRLLSLLTVLLGMNDEKYGTIDARENAEQLMNKESVYYFCQLASQCHFDEHSSASLRLQKADMGQSAVVLDGNISDEKVYTSTQLSAAALQCLEQLVTVHKSIDSRGVPYFPIPITKRLICENSISNSLHGDVYCGALSIVCQCLLSRNAEVVTVSARLINLLMAHNEKACCKLYLTGAFFFVCTNQSSSWQFIAELIHKTHLHQAFFSGADTCVDNLESPPESQSILADMIPQGLLKVLMNHGPKTFAEVFVGTHDTPEVIWSPDMRHHLVSLILEHLGDFPKTLREEKNSNYVYCPIPPIKYSRLDKEIFCHNYYLNNLCDENQFPNWEIHEPFSVFRSCIERWKEVSKYSYEEEELTVKKAKALFNLKDGADANELRRAFRKVAKKCHLAKGPNSLEVYRSIQAAYDALHSTMESPSNEKSEEDEFSHADTHGLNLARSQMYPTFLLMKSQLLICKRYSDEIGKYKYPAYSILLSCLQLPPDSELHSTFLSLGRAKFIRTAIELLFYSCLVSPLSGEELVREGGVQVLANLLQSFVAFMSSLEREKLAEYDAVVSLHMESLVHVVHTIAGVSYFDFGRSAIAELPGSFGFYSNWKSCIDLKFIGNNIHGCNLLKRFALEGLVTMTKNVQLQTGLSQTGLIWNLIHCCLDYDPTLALTCLDTEEFERSISQKELNYYGGISARALGMLCGVMKDDFSSPSNEALFDAMKHVLTPPVARMLSSNDSEETLRTLNLNVESPMILWDVKMRGELMHFVAEMESKTLHEDISFHLKAAEDFKYSNLADEINIGGVYVRLFNNMDIRDAIREIPNIQHFTQSLIRFIGRSLLNDKGMSEAIERTYVESCSKDEDKGTMNIDKESVWCPVTSGGFLMCVDAILCLAKIDGLVDDILCEMHAVGILLSLIILEPENQAFPIALDILSQIGTKQAFASSIVKRDLLPWYLSTLIFQLEDNLGTNNAKQDPRWSVLETLASTSPVASSLVESSGWFELLSVLTGCSQFTKNRAAREGAARTMARLLHDPQVSTTTASLLQRIIPTALVTLLKNNGPEALLLAFDEDSETPELVWDASMRIELRQCISNFIEKLFNPKNQRIMQSTSFSLPAEFRLKYCKTENEMSIGGVYLRLYLEDPSFPLHDYNGFLQALLVRWLEEMEQSTEQHFVTDSGRQSFGLGTGPGAVELVTNSIICTCKIRPFLLEKLSSWGYTKHVVNFIMKAKKMNLIEMPLLSAFRVLLLLSSELFNVEDLVTVVDAQGRNGVVDATMRAIDGNPLHPDSALMVEALRNVFRTALGDVESCATMERTINPVTDTAYMAYTMAPSPAPGTESVNKMKKTSSDHPLAMMFGDDAPSSPIKTSRAVRPNNKQPVRRQMHSSVSRRPSDHPQPRNTNRQLRSTFKADQVVHSNTPHSQLMPNTGFTSHPRPVQNSFTQVPRASTTSHSHQGVQAPSNTLHDTRLRSHISAQNSSTYQPQPSSQNLSPVHGNSFTNPNIASSQTLSRTQGLNLPRQHNGLHTALTHNSQATGVSHAVQSQPVTNSLLPSSSHLNSGANTHHLQKYTTRLKESPLTATAQLSPDTNVEANLHPSQYSTSVQYSPMGAPISTISQRSITTIPVNEHATSAIQPQHQFHSPYAITSAAVNSLPVPTPTMIADERIKTADGAPNSARGRKVLLDSALACGLPQFLINSILENPNINSIKDPSIAKAHSVELLHLMLKDPGYGMKFELVLDAMPTGNKYKPQTRK